jgi:hypothetical protein
MKHEGIGVLAELGHDEGNALSHQPRHERNIPRKPVQFGNQDTASGLAGRGQRCCQLRATVDRIGALAAFGFDVFGDDRDLFGFCEARDRGALGLNAEAGAVLLLCGDTIVSNSAIHTNCIPPFAVCISQ